MRAKQIFFQSGHGSGQQAHEKMSSVTNHRGIANQNHDETSLHNEILEWPSSGRQEIRGAGKDVVKRKRTFLVGI